MGGELVERLVFAGAVTGGDEAVVFLGGVGAYAGRIVFFTCVSMISSNC